MPYVDIAFRLTGKKIPVDHGYRLYAAVSQIVPAVHATPDIGLLPVRGRFAGDGTLALTPGSRLTLRLPDTRIHLLLPLAGKLLEVEGCKLRVGVPEVRALMPASALYTRLATIKGFMEPESFRTAALRQLERLGVTADLRTGQRRTLRVKARQIVGFDVLALDLAPDQSLRLQEAGIGGRRHMGCGVFVPVSSAAARRLLGQGADGMGRRA